MHLFHQPDLLGDTVSLSEEEAHHALHVLRLKAGDRIGLLDGKGQLAEATLIDVGKRQVIAHIEVRTTVDQERAARIHLAVAPTKQMDRYEWFVEKAVELGVDRITPLITERTERGHLRADRLQRVAIAAMKQSQRRWLPRINGLTPLKELLAEPLPGQRYFGWCEGDHTSLMQAYAPNSDGVVLIGPEGDFTMEEAVLLRKAEFNAVSIGSARLRTETASVAACTWMSLAQQQG